MTKLLVFGATGHLGKEIVKIAAGQGYDLTVVVRNKRKAETLADSTGQYIVADVTDPGALVDICNGFDAVIAALGKSVSPNDTGKPTFYDIDLRANSVILEEAQKSGVKKFVYVSAFHAEKYLHLDYFRVHHEMAERLKTSGINYSIIKPPALFSGFLDMIDMAKKGQLITLGKGDKRTNPVYEAEVAHECVRSIEDTNVTIEIGGKTIYTRRQLNEIIQREVCPAKTTKMIPLWLFTLLLPMLKLFDKNLYDKFAFFAAVIQEDTIAPPMGQMTFEAYIKLKYNERNGRPTS
ncbi:SDR family oxidoreductase [Runella slithyformis]|uniref:NAD-dependent epimerase/dehydratase n=1 Tax=Runella slithyformis (strain ATCC 29530 / DSM 19594 / LMG 11500 / NCIMB 11436 / LSU 4) TaxID=761193 RepID=A0A7U3ZP89_RUNSL|nr:SDR family oxidoreductase [Runella slithyformis]AEI50783.1 NAD-dependent epimerase/dehydratase [Runella slithyformis DSM 19594]